MKKLEYLFNLIYYFSYKFMASYLLIIINYNPLFPIWKLHYRRESVKKKWLEKGIEDPYENHRQNNIKNFTNPKMSIATMQSFAIPTISIVFIFFMIYHILEGIFFPNFEIYFTENIGDLPFYQFSIFGVISFGLGTYWVEGKSPKYFKEFDKKKGWWRIKWKIITFLSPILTLTFALGSTYTENFIEYLKVIF